jgi:hypothetical protein
LRLLVAGSIALDSLRGGSIPDQLGGSATYFSLSASLFAPVMVVAPVGRDARDIVRPVLERRGGAIDLSGLEVLDAPTYRWFADAVDGHNVDLGSKDAIYDDWRPRPPRDYRGWAFCGSMRPDRQLQAARALAGCGLLAADAMRSYVEADLTESNEVLSLADWYFANEEEMAALGGSDPEEFRRRWGLDGLVVKRGPGGATAYTERGSHHQPAMFTPPAVDTTGAGDCLAGAMMARWLHRGGAPDALPEALRWGVAAATIGISDLGVRAIAAASHRDVERLATGAGHD